MSGFDAQELARHLLASPQMEDADPVVRDLIERVADGEPATVQVTPAS